MPPPKLMEPIDDKNHIAFGKLPFIHYQLSKIMRTFGKKLEKTAKQLYEKQKEMVNDALHAEEARIAQRYLAKQEKSQKNAELKAPPAAELAAEQASKALGQENAELQALLDALEAREEDAPAVTAGRETGNDCDMPADLVAATMVGLPQETIG